MTIELLLICGLAVYVAWLQVQLNTKNKETKASKNEDSEALVREALSDVENRIRKMIATAQTKTVEIGRSVDNRIGMITSEVHTLSKSVNATVENHAACLRQLYDWRSKDRTKINSNFHDMVKAQGKLEELAADTESLKQVVDSLESSNSSMLDGLEQSLLHMLSTVRQIKNPDQGNVYLFKRKPGICA